MTEPLTGVRGTKYSQGTEVSLVRDVADKIYLLQPEDAPLTTFTRGIGGKEPTDTPKFEWLESDIRPGVVTVSGSAGTGTTINVGTGQGTRVRIGDILISGTGESILVTDISTDALTVTRSMGAVAATTLTDGYELVIAGNALAEGSDAVTSVYTKKETLYNYIQVFKDTVSLTEVQNASKSIGGNDRKFQQMVKAIEHKRGIEQAFLFGDRFEDTSGTQVRRGTGGLLFHITTNVTDVDGVITESDFEEFCRTLFRYHPTVTSPKKLFLANPVMVSGINFWAKNALQITQNEKTYGIRIATYRSGHGDLDIVKHWLLSDLSQFSTYNFALDPSNVKYRYLPGLDTKLHLDTQAKSVTISQDEYRTYAGLQVMQEKTHGILHGITGFAA
jgi:hypothetical protein